MIYFVLLDIFFLAPKSHFSYSTGSNILFMPRFHCFTAGPWLSVTALSQNGRQCVPFPSYFTEYQGLVMNRGLSCHTHSYLYADAPLFFLFYIITVS